MSSFKLHFTILLLLCFSLSSFAQTDNQSSDSNAVATDLLSSYHKKSAIALNISSVGLGLEYAYNLNNSLNLRARINYLAVNDYTTNITVEEQPVIVIGNANLANLDVAIEYLPFQSSSFKLVGGLSYFFDANGSVNVLYDDDLQYGEIEISKEEVGDITLGLDYPGLAPYAGLGFGRAVPKGRFGFGFEIGTYYVGSPDVSLEASKMLSPTKEEELEQLEDNFSGYAWLPFINLRLAVKL